MYSHGLPLPIQISLEHFFSFQVLDLRETSISANWVPVTALLAGENTGYHYFDLP
jgi:hypothetical protein